MKDSLKRKTRAFSQMFNRRNRKGPKFDYSYRKSDLMTFQETLFQNNGTTDILAVEKRYDMLNRITAMAYAAPHNEMSSGYVYNDAGLRQYATRGSGEYWYYQYDAMGQVLTAQRFCKQHNAAIRLVACMDEKSLAQRVGRDRRVLQRIDYLRPARHTVSTVDPSTGKTVYFNQNVYATIFNIAEVRNQVVYENP